MEHVPVRFRRGRADFVFTNPKLQVGVCQLGMKYNNLLTSVMNTVMLSNLSIYYRSYPLYEGFENDNQLINNI